MTKEVFTKRWTNSVSQEKQLISDLNSIIRDELIKFCQAKIPAEWIGDEVIVVDEFLNQIPER